MAAFILVRLLALAMMLPMMIPRKYSSETT